MCYLCTNNCSGRGEAGGVGAIATELKSGPGVAKTKEQIGEEKKFCLCNSAKSLIGPNHVPLEKHLILKTTKLMHLEAKTYGNSSNRFWSENW